MGSIVLGGAGLGTIVVPPVSNWLISNYDWRTTYLVLGGAALVIITLGAQFLRRDPSQVGQSPYGAAEAGEVNLKTKSAGLTAREALRTRQFWMLAFLSFCDGYFVFAIIAHIVPHITDLGISDTVAAGILALYGGLNMLGRIGGGALADRIGSKPTLFASFILTTLTFSMLLVITKTWAFYLFAFAIGLGNGGVVGVKPAMIAELFGLRFHGVIYGLNIFITFTGGAIGAAAVGGIFDATGSYTLAFTTCIFTSISALILTAFLKPMVKGGEHGTQGTP